MRIADGFLRLAASGKVPGARVEKACACSPGIRDLCQHFQGGVLVLEGLDACMKLVIGPAELGENGPLWWPLSSPRE